MKASEAKQASSAVADRLEKERVEKAKKDREARIRQKIARRKKFVTELQDRADEYIKWAIDSGEKTATLYIGDQKDRRTDAAEQFSKHEFLGDIMKLMAKLRKDGYKVTDDVSCTQHTTQHESSVPDYDYYTYHAYILISWE